MQLNRLRYVDPKSSQFPKGRTSKGLICILATGKRNYGTQLFYRKKKKIIGHNSSMLIIIFGFLDKPSILITAKTDYVQQNYLLDQNHQFEKKITGKKIYNSSVINNMTLRLCIVAHSIFVNPDVLFLNNLIITIIRKKDLTFEALSYFSS